jgi:hypothetical protein
MKFRKNEKQAAGTEETVLDDQFAMTWMQQVRDSFLYEQQKKSFQDELVEGMLDGDQNIDSAGSAFIDLLIRLYEESGMGSIYELYEEEFPKMNSWVDMRNLAERAFSEAIQREKLVAIAAMKQNGPQ